MVTISCRTRVAGGHARPRHMGSPVNYSSAAGQRARRPNVPSPAPVSSAFGPSPVPPRPRPPPAARRMTIRNREQRPSAEQDCRPERRLRARWRRPALITDCDPTPSPAPRGSPITSGGERGRLRRLPRADLLVLASWLPRGCVGGSRVWSIIQFRRVAAGLTFLDNGEPLAPPRSCLVRRVPPLR